MKTLCAIKQGSLKDKDQHTRGKLEVCEFPDRDVGPEDVKVKVAYCAICGSDPHIVEGIFGPITGPRGLGHEVSGVVVELGSQAGKSGQDWRKSIRLLRNLLLLPERTAAVLP